MGGPSAWTRRFARGAILVALAGCAAPSRLPPDLAEAARALDEMQRLADEYGTISVAPPILSAPDGRFAFDLKDQSGADRRFKAAKAEVQGGSAVLDQYIRTRGLHLGVKADPAVAAQVLQDLARVAAAEARAQRIDGLRRRAAETRYDAALDAAEAEPDPAKRAEMEAAAAEALADALPAPSAEDLAPPARPDPANLPPLPEGKAPTAEDLRDVLADPKFQAPQALLKGVDPTVTDRQAIITAAGDNAVEAIFRILGEPQEAQRFGSSRVVFGITTLGIAPGWRTQEDFVGRIDVQVGLVFKPASREFVRGRLASDGWRGMDAATRAAIEVRYGLAAPPVAAPAAADGDPPGWLRVPQDYVPYLVEFAGPAAPAAGNRLPKDDIGYPVAQIYPVSPLTQASTLELRSSARRRTEDAFRLALSLVTPGASGETEAVMKTLRDLEQDDVSRSVDVEMSTYGTGNMFGFQVGPSYRARTDPGGGQADAGYRLGRSTSPVLLIIGTPPVPDAYVEPDGNGHLTVLQPHLRFSQSVAWAPRTDPGCLTRGGLAPSRVMELATRLEPLREFPRPSAERHAVGVGHVRARALAQHLFGAWSDVPYLAAGDPPRAAIVGTSPARVTVPASVTAATPHGFDAWLLVNGLSPERRDVEGVEVLLPAGGSVAVAVRAGAPDFTVHEGSVRVRLATSVARGTVLLGLRLRDAAGRVGGGPLLVGSPIVLESPEEAAPVARLVVPWRLPPVARGDAPRRVALTVFGEHLDQADLASFRVRTGGAFVFGGADDPDRAEAPNRDQGPRLVDGSVELTLVVHDGALPLVIAYARRGAGAGRALYAPPVGFGEEAPGGSMRVMRDGREQSLLVEPGTAPIVIDAGTRLLGGDAGAATGATHLKEKREVTEKTETTETRERPSPR